MKSMLKVGQRQWHESDFAQTPFGREEDHDTIEGCISYLRTSGANRPEAASERSHRAKSKVVSARIKQQATRGTDSALQEENARLKQAVNRLLAFVPPRASEITQARLQEIVGSALTTAGAIFGGSEVSAVLIPEEDPDSTAAYRLTVLLRSESEDYEALAEGSFALQRAMAEELTAEEFSSVRLAVDLA